MVAAQWGDSRDSDARTGGGVAGRFRLLGASADVPDPAPPEFGTAPWGYRRSEVDAWAAWVAGLVAHGRNETLRADSAEATLKATLDRLEHLERPRPQPDGDTAAPAATPIVALGGGLNSAQPTAAADADPDDAERDTPPDGDGTNHSGPRKQPTRDAATRGAVHGDPVAGDPVVGDPATGTTAEKPDTSRPRTGGRLHFAPPTDLPRRTARAAPQPTDTAPPNSEKPDEAEKSPENDKQPADHDLVRLQVVETTLHEVMALLQNLAGRQTDGS